MAMHSSTTDHLVCPAQVWRHLSTDLQVHVIRLLAQLAAHLVLTETEGEHAQLARKETRDALSVWLNRQWVVGCVEGDGQDYWVFVKTGGKFLLSECMRVRYREPE